MSRRDIDGRSSRGARASNAGDLYGFAWCARRMLDMLHPRRELELIVMEGTGEEILDFGDGPEEYLSTDMAELYGGARAATASRIVLTQFKYSYSDPQKPWTLARLCYGRSSAQVRTSVIGKMAADWQQVSGDCPGGERRVEAVLRSNQPLADDARARLVELKAAVTDTGEDGELGIDDLSAQAQETWRRLEEATGLDAGRLRGFLAALSLEAFGAGDLRETMGQLADEVGQWGLPAIDVGMNSLLVYARECATAGAEKRITKAQVYGQLKLREGDFHPSPYAPQALPTEISTQSACDLRSAIDSVESGLVLLHGAAGSGKSVVIQQLFEAYEDGGCIVYDFWAGGEAHRVGADTWSAAVCLTQIINDLDGALQTGVFANAEQSVRHLRRRLRETLDRAAEIAREENRRVVIALDAADSAIEGHATARDWGTAGVPALPIIWHFPIPEGVVLVASCRTENIASLGDLPSYTEVEIQGFSRLETATFLRALWPQMPDEDCECVHGATRGNPRILAKLTSAAVDEPAPLQYVLSNAAQELFHFYEEAVAQVESRYRELSALLALLVEAVLPIPMDDLAAAADVSLEDLRRILESLSIGLVIRPGDHIAFADQDFYEFACERAADQRDDAADVLADYCLHNESESEYADHYVAQHLFRAHRWTELIEKLVERAPARSEQVPVGRREVLQDIRRGLVACSSASRLGDAVKLLIVAAEAQRVWDVFGEALLEHPRAAVAAGYHRFWLREMEEDGVPRTLLRAKLRIGRILSETDEETDHVTSLLTDARQLDSGLREEERGLSLDEWESAVAMRISAEGHDQAAAWLLSLEGDGLWRLFATFGGQMALLRPQQCVREIEDLSLDADQRAFALIGALAASTSLPKAHVRDACAEVAQWLQSSDPQPEEMVKALPDVIMCGLIRGARKRDLRAIVGHWVVPRPHFVPFDNDNYESMLIAHAACVAARETLSMAEIPVGAPIERRATSRQQDDREDREVQGHIDLQLPAQRALWKAAAGGHEGEVHRDLEACLSAWEDLHESGGTYHLSSYRVTRYYRFAATAMFRALALASAVETDLGSRVLGLAKELMPTSIVGLPEMIEASAACPALSPVAEEMITAARDQLLTPNVSGNEAVDGLLKVSATAFDIDPQRGLELFQEARAAAAQLGGCLHSEARLLANVGRRAATALGDTQAAARQLAASIRRISQTTWDQDKVDLRGLFRVLGAMDPVVALESALWFQHCGDFEFEDVAGPAVAACVLHDDVSPDNAWPLAHLGSDGDQVVACCEAAIKRMQTCGSRRQEAIDAALKLAARALQTQGWPASRPVRAAGFVEWAGNEGFGNHPTVAELDEWVERTGAFAQAEQSWDRWAPDDSYDDDVADARRRVASEPNEYLEELRDRLQRGDFASRQDYAILLGVSEQVPSRHIPALVAAVEAWSEAPTTEHKLAVLVRCLGEDRFGRTRREQVIDSTINIIGSAADDLLELDSFEPALPSGRLAELLADSWQEYGSRLLQAATSRLHATSADGVYALAALFADKLAPPEAAEVLNFLLNRWSGDDEPPELPGLQRDRPEIALRQLLCRLLGHPRQDLRWRAAYALLDMCLTDPSTVAVVLGAAGDESIDRWMSVREWAMFVIRCVSLKRPSLLAPHVDQIAGHALDKGFPHACIREHAKAALIALARMHTDALPEELRSALERVNEPVACRIDDGCAQPEHYDGPFRFNAVDTMPYVFSPMARAFGKHRCDVCRAAEKWLRQWGVTKYPPDSEEWIKRIRRGPNWHLAHATHGSHPAIQHLEEYYDRHLVQVVAGEWIDTQPAFCERAESTRFQSWESWLGHEGTPADPALTSLLLGPPPVVPDCWGRWGGDVEEWLADWPDDDVLRELHARRNGVDWLVIAASRHSSSDDRSLYVEVRSAVVPAETSRAYARMLACEDSVIVVLPQQEFSYDIRLGELEQRVTAAPDEEPGPSEDAPPEFSAIPVSSRIHTEFPYHGFDPLWPRHGRGFLVPSLQVCETLGLQRDVLALRWRDRGGTMIAGTEVWDVADSGLSAEGTRLVLHPDMVSRLLAQTGSVLATVVSLQKSRSGLRSGFSDIDFHRHMRLFLMDESGEMTQWTAN